MVTCGAEKTGVWQTLKWKGGVMSVEQESHKEFLGIVLQAATSLISKHVTQKCHKRLLRKM